MAMKLGVLDSFSRGTEGNGEIERRQKSEVRSQKKSRSLSLTSFGIGITRKEKESTEGKTSENQSYEGTENSEGTE